MSLNIKKSSIYYMIIFAICFADINCFYLINTSKVYILGISYGDVLFLIKIIFCLIVFIKYVQLEKVYCASLGMLFAFLLAVLSAIAGMETYNQPFLMGISSQHLWLGCIITFFPIMLLLKRNIISINGLIKELNILCLGYLSICILQYLLSNSIIFTFSGIQERYGESRFNFSIGFLLLICGFLIDSLLSINKDAIKVNIMSVIILSGTLFLSIAITKNRMLTLSIVGSLLICLLCKKGGALQKVITIAVIFFGICFLLSTQMGQDLSNVFGGGVSTNDTLSIRQDAKEYYISLLKSSKFKMLFGCGNPNINWKPAMDLTNPLWSKSITAKFYLEDVGLVGIAVRYGLVGVAWWALLMLYSLKKSIYVYHKTGKTAYMFFVLSDIIGCATLVPILFNNKIVFSLFFAMLNNEYSKIKNKRILDGQLQKR